MAIPNVGFEDAADRLDRTGGGNLAEQVVCDLGHERSDMDG